MTETKIPSTEFQTLSRKSTFKIDVGDIYLFRSYVYRVAVCDEGDDRVMLSTTNDSTPTPRWIKRRELTRVHGFVPCPLELREPAIQVFELEEEVSDKSYECTAEYRKKNLTNYIYLSLARLLPEVEKNDTREYVVPDAQAVQFPDLQGKKFNLPVLFYSLTRQEAEYRYNEYLSKFVRPSYQGYWEREASKVSWPLVYIPWRYRRKK